MFVYELKKILQKKVNLITMAVGYLILMITAIYPVTGETEYLYSQGVEMRGLEAVRYNQEFAKNQTEELTEEYITGVLKEINQSHLNPASDEGYLMLSERYGNLYRYLERSYRQIGQDNYDPNILMDKKKAEHAEFYEHTRARVKEYVNRDFSAGNYTDAEKNYWIEKSEKVKTPFAWGDIYVQKQYVLIVSLIFYLLFVLIVCLSPVFAAEHEKGTAGILLASKNGQRKLARAKLAASCVFGFGYVIVGYLIAFVWLFINIGAEGFDLPVQLLDSAICKSMTMGQYLLLELLIAAVTCMFGICLTLFLSAKTKSTMGTMTFMLAFLIIPAFIPLCQGSRFLNHIIALATVRIVDLKTCMTSFIDYRLGSVILDLPTFAIVFYLILSAVLALRCLDWGRG